MQVNYQYASPSMCYQQEDQTILGFSADKSRAEKVSFVGKLKHPLIFRDAMLMLREIVISDLTQKTKGREDYFEWLSQEIERRILEHLEDKFHVRGDLITKIYELNTQIHEINKKPVIIHAIKTSGTIKKIKEIQKQFFEKNRL